MIERELKEGKKGKVAVRLRFVVVTNSEILQKIRSFLPTTSLQIYMCYYR
jgi:hypothetical protein